MLIAGTYEKAICGWELGKKQSVTPAFQVTSPCAFLFAQLRVCGVHVLTRMRDLLAAPVASRAHQGGGEPGQVPC